MIPLLIIIGVIIAGVGILILIHKNGVPFNATNAALVILFFAGCVLTTWSYQKQGINETIKPLIKEVDLHKVPVKGYNSFRAEITITYKDGELETIKLAEGTTAEATSPRK